MTFLATQMAPTGSTGNNTHGAATVGDEIDLIGFNFVVEAAGATPTVTFKVQGSFDNTNWFDIPWIGLTNETTSQAGQTVTAVGATPFWLSFQSSRFIRKVRLVTSANTNVTYHCDFLQSNAD